MKCLSDYLGVGFSKMFARKLFGGRPGGKRISRPARYCTRIFKNSVIWREVRRRRPRLTKSNAPRTQPVDEEPRLGCYVYLFIYFFSSVESHYFMPPAIPLSDRRNSTEYFFFYINKKNCRHVRRTLGRP